MNTTKAMITRIASVTGLTLGAFALSVAAQSVWTPPTAPPPGNNVDAPLNVGAVHQTKLKGLSINTTLTNPDVTGLNVWGMAKFFGNIEIGTAAAPKTIKIVDGKQAAGKVLTSVDNTGLAEWRDPAGGGAPPAASSIPENLKVFDRTTTWTAPANVTRVRARVWGAGGGGAGRNTSAPNPGGGGGAGGYTEAIVPVTPNATYTITVGSGGAGGLRADGADKPVRCGKKGTDSSFHSLVIATGGGGGHSGCGDGFGYSGGLGGGGSIVVPAMGFAIQGGDGATGTLGQSEGGNAPMGGTGSGEFYLSGAKVPGGGGGGGVSSGPDGLQGATGWVVIEY